jgi:hypothetical protein
MMRTLLILRCLDRVAADAWQLRGGEFSIGRGSENEWVQTKPERHFSKRSRHSQAADRSPIRRPILHSSISIRRTRSAHHCEGWREHDRARVDTNR